MTFQQYSGNEPAATGGQCVDFIDPNDRFSGCSATYVRLTTHSHYERSQGSINSALNPIVNLLEESVTVGTASGTPSWQFINVLTTNNRLLTVTAIVQGSIGNSIGSSCTVNGSSVNIIWVNCDTGPNFSGCWDIIKFEILRDSSNVVSVFGYVEGYTAPIP